MDNSYFDFDASTPDITPTTITIGNGYLYDTIMSGTSDNTTYFYGYKELTPLGDTPRR